MKRGLAMAKAVVAILAGICSIPVFAAGAPEEAVKEALTGYEEAWSKHDADAVAGFYYEPAMRVSRAGPAVRATRSDQKAFFEGFLRGMVERGYARSEWESLEVRLLDDDTAVASGVTVRRREDGSLLERAGVTYALRKSADGWKIFMSATHSPDNALQFR